jgi:aspartate aminotransferase
MISDEMRELIRTGSEIRKMWERSFELKRLHGPENVADMTLGNPVTPPPEGVLRALEDLVSNPPPDLHRYTPNAGLPEVRERIAEHLDAHGLLPGARSEHVVMTAGASGATNIVLRAVLDPGDEVILLAPYFPDYPAHVLNHHGVTVPVPTLPNFLPDLSAIEKALGPKTRLLILNHPNNPSGRLYPEPVLRDIVDLVRAQSRENGRVIYLLSDEPYREICFTDEPFVSPAKLYEHGLMAYSFSKSKSIPGERIGYLALNPESPAVNELAAAFSLANRILGFTSAPSLWQHVIARSLECTVDIEPLCGYRDRLLTALAAKGYEVIPPDGTFYLFPRTPGGDDAAFVKRLMESLLMVAPGATFGHSGHFRMAFCVDEHTVDLAVERLPTVE